MKKYITLAIAIALIILAFFLGRKTVKPEVVTKVTTKYIQGKTVTNTITDLKYKIVCMPPETLIVEKAARDSINLDTLGIMIDWATKRQYDLVLFDVDTLGRCDLSLTLHYNQLDSLNYSYTPITKETTVEKQAAQRLLDPFIGGGVQYPWGMFIEGGTFIKQHHGIVMRVSSAKDVSLGYVYKF